MVDALPVCVVPLQVVALAAANQAQLELGALPHGERFCHFYFALGAQSTVEGGGRGHRLIDDPKTDVTKKIMRKKNGHYLHDQGGALIMLIPADFFAHDFFGSFRKCGIIK